MRSYQLRQPATSAFLITTRMLLRCQALKLTNARLVASFADQYTHSPQTLCAAALHLCRSWSPLPQHLPSPPRRPRQLVELTLQHPSLLCWGASVVDSSVELPQGVPA
jgi:hypothetical protein